MRGYRDRDEYGYEYEYEYESARVWALVVVVWLLLLTTGCAGGPSGDGRRAPVDVAADPVVAPAVAEDEVTQPAPDRLRLDLELERSPSRLSDQAVDPASLTLPARPAALELGDPFLAAGPISEGFVLPTGAVWQPSLLAFGTLRSAVNAVRDRAGETHVEWVNRLDLFAELRLTGTERLVIGVRPLDRDGQFVGFELAPDGRFREEAFDARISTLFFEGDVGELFPDLDIDDRGLLDLGLAIGRQRLVVGDGLIVDDTVDAVGLTRNNLQSFGLTHLQLTALFGVSDVHRGDNQRDAKALLFGLTAEADLSWATVDGALVLVTSSGSGGDGLHGGVGLVGRFGELNLTARMVGSVPLGAESDVNSAGAVLFAEASWVPHGTHDNLYLNAFWGLGEYRSAARSPDAGGPLGRTGLLFASVGLGSYGPALSSQPDDAVGAALGYQWIVPEPRRQVVLELGGRLSTASGGRGAGVAARFSQAFGQRYLLVADAFGAAYDGGETAVGGRLELQVKF